MGGCSHLGIAIIGSSRKERPKCPAYSLGSKKTMKQCRAAAGVTPSTLAAAHLATGREAIGAAAGKRVYLAAKPLVRPQLLCRFLL